MTTRATSLLDDDTGFHLAVASARLTQATNRALKALDLRARHYAALVLASERDDLTQVDLAREIALAASQVVPLVDELERRGLVQRRVADDDRRRRLVTVTDDGRQLLERARREVAAARDAALSALDAQQRDALLGSLKVLNAGDRDGRDGEPA